MNIFIENMTSGAIKKPSFLFTLLTILFGVNLYLVKFHNFTIFELQANFNQLKYIEFFYLLVAYSFIQIFGVHVYSTLEAIKCSFKEPSRWTFNKNFPSVPYSNLERIALYQANDAAYMMLKDYRKEVEERNHRLLMSFFFILAMTCDIIMSRSQSIFVNILNSSHSELLCTFLGFVTLNAVLNFWHLEREDRVIDSKTVNLFDINEDVGRVLLKNFYNSYEHQKDEDKKRQEESFCPMEYPNSAKD
ncbi:hypothetical protein [Maridesulfovibrio hydrothermalis]|uniref:Uncharacterized protein n=1 Tax=Maridesulfovibrio hydrothermalis AM13 = DSM 14728 TaxID=1121451 RepID=L0R5R3_9BACT|nr:hypothetical protein [Maridesulfovibrio hydrothermalis]CCO21999.1 membrane protein of unknown function [Maridesulfovibrio hydrothermalis AM13 = DSM 14728]